MYVHVMLYVSVCEGYVSDDVEMLWKCDDVCKCVRGVCKCYVSVMM